MSQQELLKKVIKTLEKNIIPYMITGSIASSLQGEPRSTHDIDVVINITEGDIVKIVNAFRQLNFYIDEGAVLKAIEKKSTFNIIDVHEGNKVDFWILSNSEFDKSRFMRRISEKIMGIEIFVSAPEDTILAKLRWAKLSGGSEKQFSDALRVYEIQYGHLDMKYLGVWVKKLYIDSFWERLKKEAKTIKE